MTSLSTTLIHSRGLRTAIFASSKIIRCDIVWESLIDSEDCSSLHSLLTSLLSNTGVQKCEESAMHLLRLVDAKLNSVQHIIEQLEASSFMDGTVNESYLSHCMSENCFLLEFLLKLRKSCFDAKNLQVGWIMTGKD